MLLLLYFQTATLCCDGLWQRSHFGGTAGIVQAVTGITRLSSTALTIGLGNAVVASVESIGAITLSVLALVAPVIAIGLVATLLIATLTKFFQSRATSRE